MKVFYVMVAAMCIAGCSYSTGVVPIGNETYMISTSRKGFVSGSEVKADAFIEANEYCANYGKKIEPVSTREEGMKVFRSDAFAELQFKCIPK